MAKKLFPASFQSYEEYDMHATCLMKAVPGSMVEIYFAGRHGYYTPSSRATDFSFPVIVVGRTYNYNSNGLIKNKFTATLFLGTKDRTLGFWSTAHRDIENLEYGSLPSKTFPYGFYGHLSEIKYKKLHL